MGSHLILLSNQQYPGMNPVQCGWERCEKGHAFGPAVRSYLLLHYVVSGFGRFTVGERTYSLKPGQMFIIRPFEMTFYEAAQAEPWHYIWIGFSSGVPLPASLEEDVLTLPQAGPIFAAMTQADTFTGGREAFLCGKIWELLSVLWRQESSVQKPGEAGEYVNVAKTYMETEYMRGISVSALAQRLGLDRSYFSQLFKQTTGLSPQQYLTRLRLEKGAQLMVDHGHTPGEAALSTGYPDVFSFSRMFKSHYGVSPRAYVQQSHQVE